MELIQTKSLLAKLMATENLHIEQRPVGTASFDVESRILTIPVLDKNLSSYEYDLFMGHEVGHALYTPLDGLKKAHDLKLSMSAMNVLEDSRIERKIKAKYPGIRQSFIRAYKELIAKDFFGTKNYDINQLNFIDRVNLYCKAGQETGIVFSEVEQVLLIEIESTQTYDEVIEVCKKVTSHMKEERKNDREKERVKPKFSDYDDFTDEYDEENNCGEDSDEDAEEYIGSKQGRAKKFDEEESDGNGTDKVETAAEDFDEDEDSGGDGTATGGSGAGGSGKRDPEIVSETDNAYRRNESRLFSEDSRRFFYGNVPDLDLDEIIIDHKFLWNRYRTDMALRKKMYADNINNGIDTKAFQKFREDSKKVVSYLVKEFELRKNAEQMSRATIAKTGELNMSKIFSYQFSEDLFKKISVVPGGKSHGLVMFVDWSGSMSGNMENTIRQLLNLVMFCKKVNIPFEVYAFTTNYDGSGYSSYRRPEQAAHKRDDMVIGSFALMNLLSNRMNSVEYSYAAAALLNFSNRYNYKPDWFQLSGTPLNEAIISAMKIVPKFQKENKLQVVNTVFLTDGEGTRNLEIHNGIGGYHVQTGKNCCVVIRDPITKNEARVESRNARDLSAAYIKLLKGRTNCNIVGFYILGSREYSSQFYNLGVFKYDYENRDNNDIIREKLKTEFRNNKYQVVTSAGYDEYYLLRSESLDIGDSEFEVKENATVRGIATAFSKFTNSRKTSRVVLNRFIGMII